VVEVVAAVFVFIFVADDVPDIFTAGGPRKVVIVELEIIAICRCLFCIFWEI
jgi:hypothetical protein